MTSQILAKMTEFYRAQLTITPEACRHHFHAIWCDYRLRMWAEKWHCAELFQEMHAKLSKLEDPRLSALPVDLYRFPGEDTIAYLDRCHASSGFFTPVVMPKKEEPRAESGSPCRMVKCLSVRQPWAHCILHPCGPIGWPKFKDIENRSWGTSFRGRLYIHAGKKVEKEDVGYLLGVGVELPDSFVTGAVLGSVDLVNVTHSHPSRWAFSGQAHWVLAGPKRLSSPIEMKGQLGLFEIIEPMEP